MTNDHSLRTYDSMLGLLSSEDNPTPLVRLNHVVPHQHTTFLAKLEWYNPFGAIKDRVAANLIDDAQQRNALAPGQRLVEATSGNTGLGLAMIGMAQGVFPSVRALRKGVGSPEVEEERRACFAAITRSERTLTLTRAKNYCGSSKAPSQFLHEMGVR